MSQDTNNSDNGPDKEPDVKDLLLYQVNEYFYPEMDLGDRRVKYYIHNDCITISITPSGFELDTVKIIGFNNQIRPLGYRFNGISHSYANDRLEFVLGKLEE